jgi:Fur family transcriptional regulator, ferric uptake regulator
MDISEQKPLIADDWLNSLQNHGYRITAPLRAIVDILSVSDCALGPLKLVELGRKSCPGMGLVTVYRALEKMEELGLIQRVHQSQNCSMYLRAAHGHEHLLLCLVCGKVEFFSGDNLNELIHQISKKSGFTIREHWLQLYGICSECQENKEVGIE